MCTSNTKTDKARSGLQPDTAGKSLELTWHKMLQEQSNQHPDGAAGQATSDREASLKQVWTEWQALQELLPVQRYWWKDTHFRYAQPPAMLLTRS